MIELLVVIAVVSVLTSLLLPALNNARAKGRGISCLGIIKQINLCEVQYASDNNDYVCSAKDSVAGTYWSSDLMVYSDQLFKRTWPLLMHGDPLCPSCAQDAGLSWPSSGIGPVDFSKGFYGGYMHNPGSGYIAANGTVNWPRARMNSLNAPSHKMTVVDGVCSSPNYDTGSTFFPAAEELANCLARWTRHGGLTLNSGFYDGHAEALRYAGDYKAKTPDPALKQCDYYCDPTK